MQLFGKGTPFRRAAKAALRVGFSRLGTQPQGLKAKTFSVCIGPAEAGPFQAGHSYSRTVLADLESMSGNEKPCMDMHCLLARKAGDDRRL